MSRAGTRIQWTTMVLGLLGACGGGSEPTPPPPPPPPPPAVVTTVTLASAGQTVLLGDTLRLTATIRDQNGASISGKSATWSSSSDLIATVSTSGLVTAVAPGAVIITAVVDGVSGTATLTTLPPQSPSCTECLEVVPSTILLSAAGAGHQVAVYRVDAAGGRTIATATFQSSDPALVSVSPSGRVTATAGKGAARITAQVGGVEATSALVVIAQPATGALLVSDAQIVGRGAPLDSSAVYAPGYRYKVRLRGAAPATGQIVLASGAAPVGGRVVSVAAGGPGTHDVVLEVVPIGEMFAGISINQTLPLPTSAAVFPSAIREAFSIDRSASGTINFRPRTGQRRLQASGARPTAASQIPNEFEFDLGPFGCKAKAEAATTFPVLADAATFAIDPALALDLVITDGELQRLVVQGSLSPRFGSNLLINAAVQGKVECEVELATIILPIGGPLALILGGQVPLGIGFVLEGKVEVANIGFDALVQGNVTTAFGLECTATCQAIGIVNGQANGYFKPSLPASFNDARTELKIAAFGFGKLQIGNPFLNQLQFKAVDIKLGLEQKAELASERAQADEPDYVSKFTLSTLIEAKTASEISALGNLLNIQVTELSYAPVLPPLARSPIGTFTISPDTLAPGNDVALGEQATFTVRLDPVNFLGLYAVDAVEIRWLKKDGTGALTLEPGRPGCTSITPDEDGQTEFTCQTDFLDAHLGEQKFYAFVKARLYGAPVPLLLEIGSGDLLVVEPIGVVNVRGAAIFETLAELPSTTCHKTFDPDSVPGDTLRSPLRRLDCAAGTAVGNVTSTYTVAPGGSSQPTVFDGTATLQARTSASPANAWGVSTLAYVFDVKRRSVSYEVSGTLEATGSTVNEWQRYSRVWLQDRRTGQVFFDIRAGREVVGFNDTTAIAVTASDAVALSRSGVIPPGEYRVIVRTHGGTPRPSFKGQERTAAVASRVRFALRP